MLTGLVLISRLKYGFLDTALRITSPIGLLQHFTVCAGTLSIKHSWPHQSHSGLHRLRQNATQEYRSFRPIFTPQYTIKPAIIPIQPTQNKLSIYLPVQSSVGKHHVHTTSIPFPLPDTAGAIPVMNSFLPRARPLIFPTTDWWVSVCGITQHRQNNHQRLNTRRLILGARDACAPQLRPPLRVGVFADYFRQFVPLMYFTVSVRLRRNGLPYVHSQFALLKRHLIYHRLALTGGVTGGGYHPHHHCSGCWLFIRRDS